MTCTRSRISTLASKRQIIFRIVDSKLSNHCVSVVYISGAIDSKRLERQEDIRPINTRTSLNELVGATVSWPGVPTDDGRLRFL